MKTKTGAAEPVGRLIVLYDGVCNLCTGSVRFILRRDPKGRFAFAALQSDTGRRLLAEAGMPAESMETLVLIERGRAFTRSDAALRIAQRLSGPWPALAVLHVIPRPVRDWCYRAVATRRYRWFGRRETCLLSTPEHPERFLP